MPALHYIKVPAQTVGKVAQILEDAAKAQIQAMHAYINDQIFYRARNIPTTATQTIQKMGEAIARIESDVQKAIELILPKSEFDYIQYAEMFSESDIIKEEITNLWESGAFVLILYNGTYPLVECNKPKDSARGSNNITDAEYKKVLKGLYWQKAKK